MTKRKKPDGFNPLFKETEVVVPSRIKAPPPPVPDSPPLPEESRLFLEAVSDVIPLPNREKKAYRNPRALRAPSHPPPDEEQETLAHLNGLVQGSIDMDIRFTDEYMEGAITGVGRKVLRRLRRGEFPVQDHVDLHGMTRNTARDRVDEFLTESHKKGLRCVLIVHGRGLNSPSSDPVLKKQIPLWFTRGPARKVVLAFATARPYDGGAGAVYVLLRQR